MQTRIPQNVANAISTIARLIGRGKTTVRIPPRCDVRDRQSGPQQRTDRKRPLADIPGQLQTRLMRASTALALLALASCKVAPLARQAGDQSQRSDEREITGVLTLYTEGESFQQCPLREPWNCFKAKGPECGFDATPEARTLINTEITKSGATQKYATFGIVMIGTRLDGVHAGHLSGYSCEFHARSVLHVKEVASAPPDTSNAVSVR